MKFCQNRSILPNRTTTKNGGTRRDLVFVPNSKIFEFFIHLGQVLNVLKCVLRSDNFHVILGTLTNVEILKNAVENYSEIGKEIVNSDSSLFYVLTFIQIS